MMQLSTMFQICQKDILLLVKDKSALFFTIGFPLIMAIFFGTVFSSGGSKAGISMAIADQDNSKQSMAFVETLSTSDALRVSLMSEEIATEKVRKGKVAAMIVIPEGFGEAKASLFDGNTPKIKLGIDPSRKAAVGMLQGILMAQAAKDMQEQFSDTSNMITEVEKSLNLLEEENIKEPELVDFLGSLKTWMKSEKEKQQEQIIDTQKQKSSEEDNNEAETQESEFQGFTPLIIENKDIEKEKTGPQNAYAISFPQGMIWGILGAISTFSLALVTEVRSGTLGRLSAAPISRMSILGGKALASFLTITFVLSFLVVVGMSVFGISIYSWPVLIVSILSAGIGFSGLMMFLAVLGKTEKSASGISWAIMMIMAMTGGGMIPIVIMPSWMASIGQFNPVKWVVISLEGSLWRQYSLSDLLPNTLLLLALGIITFYIGSVIFNKRAIE